MKPGPMIVYWGSVKPGSVLTVSMLAAEWGRLLHSLRTTKCWQSCRSALLYNPRQAVGYVLLRPRWCAQHQYVCWLGHVQAQLSVVSEVVLAGN